MSQNVWAARDSGAPFRRAKAAAAEITSSTRLARIARRAKLCEGGRSGAAGAARGPAGRSGAGSASAALSLPRVANDRRPLCAPRPSHAPANQSLTAVADSVTRPSAAVRLGIFCLVLDLKFACTLGHAPERTSESGH